MLKYLPYTFPLWITAMFVVFAEASLVFVGILLLPLCSLLFKPLGKFNMQTLKEAYIFFHYNKGMECLRGLSALGFVAFNIWVAYFLKTHSLSLFSLSCFIYTVVVFNSNFAIALAHDLMHSPHLINRFLGTVLLLGNGFFYLESDHLNIHHPYVATRLDPASATQSKSLYSYLWHSVSQRFLLLFGFKQSDKTKSIKVLGNYFRLAICMAFLVWAYTWSLPYFYCLLTQFIVVTFLYEIITYIQHFGLQRQMLADGHFEKIGLQHSWNCYYKLSAYLHYMMPVHSLHHIKQNPQWEQLSNAGPEYPRSFSSMAVLALVPPLYLKTMQAALEKINAQAANG